MNNKEFRGVVTVLIGIILIAVMATVAIVSYTSMSEDERFLRENCRGVDPPASCSDATMRIVARSSGWQVALLLVLPATGVWGAILIYIGAEPWARPATTA